jgi:hypothetical protein
MQQDQRNKVGASFSSSRFLLVLARKFRRYAMLLANVSKKKVMLLRASVYASCRFGFWAADSARAIDR